MELLEAVRAALTGRSRIFSADPQDYTVRGPFIDLCRAGGREVVHHDSVSSFHSYVMGREEGTPPRLVVITWDPDSMEGLEQSLLSLGEGDSALVFIPSGSKGKELSRLKALVEPLEFDPGTLSASSLAMKLSSAGIETQVGVPSILSQLVGDDFCHYMHSLKVLRLRYGEALTQSAVMGVVERMPDPDGRECLADLLHQRPGLLSERLEDLGGENLVGLFRAAGSEFQNILCTAVMLDDGRKPDAVMSELEVSDAKKRDLYLSLARKLGTNKSTTLLGLCGRAVTLLQTTPHDRSLVAYYMSLRICAV